MPCWAQLGLFPALHARRRQCGGRGREAPPPPPPPPPAHHQLALFTSPPPPPPLLSLSFLNMVSPSAYVSARKHAWAGGGGVPMLGDGRRRPGSAQLGVSTPLDQPMVGRWASPTHQPTKSLVSPPRQRKGDGELAGNLFAVDAASRPRETRAVAGRSPFQRADLSPLPFPALPRHSALLCPSVFPLRSHPPESRSSSPASLEDPARPLPPARARRPASARSAPPPRPPRPRPATRPLPPPPPRMPLRPLLRAEV